MKKYKIFIACDTKNINKAKKIIKNTKTKKLKIGYKFGLEFINSKNGRSFISKIKNKIIFADLKLNDIPNTCVSTAIVGIGFIAILQMTNFSVQSIDSSGESVRATVIIPVKQVPAQVIQKPARMTLGRVLKRLLKV